MHKFPFVIFLHIQKTGGITLQRFLRRNLGPSLFSRATSVAFKNQKKQQTIEPQYYAGHNCYGIHKDFTAPFTYMTFLREPISRLISLYKYSKQNRSAYYHRIAKGKTIEEFLLNTELHELDNGMTRMIAGSEDDRFINRTPFRQCDAGLLDQAVANIDSSFACVGIMERFDESFLLMSDFLGVRRPNYLRRNSSRASRCDVDEQIKQRLRDANELDVQLYQYAIDLHSKQWAQNGSAARLEEFRISNSRFNRWFGPAYDRYSSLKQRLRRRGDSPS